MTEPAQPPPLPATTVPSTSGSLRPRGGRLLVEVVSVGLAVTFFVLTILDGAGERVEARWWSALFVPIGLVFQSASVFEWSYFVQSPKGRFVYSLLGRTGARVFYWLFGFGGHLMAYFGVPEFLSRNGVR